MEGEWQYEPITVGSPAIGSEFVHVVPNAVVQRIICVTFRLTTDANAANRIARVEYFDGDLNTVAAFASPFTLTANHNALYSFAVGVQQFGANNAAFIGAGIPDLLLADSRAVGVNVDGLQAGDQLSDIVLSVKQRPVRD